MEFFGCSITTTNASDATSWHGRAYNHENRGSSYDNNGTYQYYWNESGEFVKEYLGGINNSKL